MVPVKPSFLPPRQACVRIPSTFHKTPVSIRCPGILTVILVWHTSLSCIGVFFFIIPSSAPLHNHTFQKRQPPFFTEGCHPQFMGQSGLRTRGVSCYGASSWLALHHSRVTRKVLIEGLSARLPFGCFLLLFQASRLPFLLLYPLKSWQNDSSPHPTAPFPGLRRWEKLFSIRLGQFYCTIMIDSPCN